MPLSYALTNAKHLDCSYSPGGMPICQCYPPFITLYHLSPTYLRVRYFYLIPTHSPTCRFLSQDTLRTLWLLCVYCSLLRLFYLAKAVLYYLLQWNLLFSLKEYYVELHYIGEIIMKLLWLKMGQRKYNPLNLSSTFEAASLAPRGSLKIRLQNRIKLLGRICVFCL